MNKLSWYWHRLRAMGPEEIASRIDHTLKKKSWKRRASWVAPQPNIRPADGWSFVREPQPEWQTLIAEADRYLKGEYVFLNSADPRPDQWHYDPMYSMESPRTYSFDIDYRNPEVAGNVKNIWEKNRHHHLTVLSLAFTLTQKEVYAQEVARLLRSWVADNPPMRGVSWTSALELGVRLISWVWTERLLRGSAVHEELFGQKGLMWNSIYWHQWILARYHSHGSSANNHLVGEMAGLFMAATVWPYYTESAEWEKKSREILVREASEQTFASGLNKEIAFTYHFFSFEFFALCALEAEWAGRPFPESYRQIMKKIVEVIPQVSDVAGNLPNYGDGDDGMALQLRPIDSSRSAWVYALGRSWLHARVPAPESLPLMAQMLGATESTEAGQLPLPQHTAFDDAGFYLMSLDRGTSREIFCTADAGPLGFLSIAAHGHADALAFTLNIGGQPVIVDPGTYIYHADMASRAYFRSTLAHNTITLDGEDQSVAGGIFMWVQKARTRLLEWKAGPEGAVFSAEHDGYTRLKGSPVHRRTLSLDAAGLTIKDVVSGSESHHIEWRLHFAPQCDVRIEGATCIVSWPGQAEGLRFALDSRLNWRTAKGEKEAGWYSNRFNVREAAWTLIGTAAVALPFTLDTHLQLTRSDATSPELAGKESRS